MMETRRKPGTRTTRLGPLIPIVVAILGASAGRSEADMGFGWGVGFQNTQQDVQFLNSWSLQNAASAAANRPQGLTAPRFQARDEGFMERYDVATREAMVNRVARDPGREMSTVSNRNLAPRATASPAPRPVAAPEPRPAVLLANFFDRERRLAWPMIAPITEGMGTKQEAADRAILTVLDQYETRGIAGLSETTEAREKLLVYGRPALDFVRKQSTTAIADSFHSFLLGLYANVGRAGTEPKGP